jgi:type I restriction enzyme S subunit
MDAQQFLVEFGHIANAPGGVAKLRELILAFAVQGRLVEQLESAESADVQVAKIRRAASVFPATGRRKKANTQSTSSLLPMAAGTLPKGWANVPLCDLVRVLNGRAYSKQELLSSGTPVLRVGNLFTSDRWYYSNLGLEDDKYCDNGDLLYAWSASFGPFIWSGEKVIYHYHIWKLDLFSSADLNKHYLYIYLLEKTQEIKAAGHGISMVHMTKERFEQLSVLLPPLEEQARIVAKVDELMALCDKLETQQQARRKLQNKLRQSTLQAVASATSPHELQTTWACLVDNFGQLFHALDDVAAFKGLILDLAVSGALLTTEMRHASTGADLIDAIADARIEWSKVAIDQEKKEALAVLKKLRIQKLSTPEEQLPKHWAWASLLEVSKVIIDCDHKTPTYSDSGVHLIRTTDIRNGEMRLDATRKVSWESYLARSRRLTPQAGDIFFTREAPMGEAAIVPNGHIVCLGQRLMLIRQFPELFSKKFLVYVIQSPGFQRRLQVAAIGMTVKHINVVDVENLVVPVPPKAEQDRIVAVVDALFRMCDHYAEQLSRKQRIATNLAASAVASLTGIAIEQEEEPMKAPQTELVAPLHLGTPPDIKAQSPLATILARHNGEMSAKDLWQRFGGEIDAFYAQLKTEVAHGWILEPAPAEMREKPADAVSA